MCPSATFLPAPDPNSDPDRVRVRYVREDDYDAVAEHLGRCFERWPPYEIDCSIRDHVAWKLRANEASWRQQVVATLDTDDGYIVALAIRIRRPAWIQGRKRVLLDVGDQSVHPDWRMMHINQKRGDFRKVEGHETHDLQMTWLPHHPATRKGNLGRPSLGNRVLVFVRPTSRVHLLRIAYRTAGWPHTVKVAFRLARGIVRTSRPTEFPGVIENLDSFDQLTDGLWETARTHFDFAIERTAAYLNWRYIDPRAGRFVARAAIDQERLVGYCVTKRSDSGGAIVDILVEPGRDDVLGALLDDAIDQIEHGRRREISCWLPQRHPYVGSLRAHGFFDSGRDPSLRYRAMAMEEDELRFLLDPNLPVHVTQGDSDFV